MGKILVTAGEPSGDMHAARIINKIREINPEIEAAGMGSTELKKAGVNILVDPTNMDSVGFSESLKNLKVHLSHIRLLKEYMRNNRPDVIFLVDYSGFNMMMARLASKMNIPAVSYFPPTAWVWGKWRAKWMARYNTHIAAVFPMERYIYERAGARVSFVGHPLLDMVEVKEDRDEIFNKLELDPGRKVILLMPGSRKKEVESLLPEMLKTAERLRDDNPKLQFILSLAGSIEHNWVSQMASKYNLVIKIVKNDPYPLMKVADLMIGASGTATLESMIMKTPMIILYKTSWSTYQLGKRLMNTEYIGLPNIIAGREVVPELIQNEARTARIYEEAEYLLHREYVLADISRKLEKLKGKLGEKGAIERTARLVLKEGGLI